MAERLCPVWVGYFLASPIRKLFHNPKKILSQYVKDGMKVLDIGCAMGFFSLPMAQMAGSNGKVICVDVQEKMFISLEKRSHKAGLRERIETRLCNNNSLCLDDLKNQIDFALAFAIVHEVPDAANFFSEVYESMKHSGKFLVAEPKGHCSNNNFALTISFAEQKGFKVISQPKICGTRAILFEK